MRGGEDHGGADSLRGEPLRGVHLDDARAHRPDDRPSAGVGPERHRARGREDHPRRHVEVGGVEVAVGEKRERDDTHRLLRVVGAVRQREQRAGDHLPGPEGAVDGAGAPLAHRLVEDRDLQARELARTQRRHDCGREHLGQQTVPVHAVHADRGQHRADDPPDQRVRRARGHREAPRQQVPGDRSHEAREHDRLGHLAGLHDPGRDRRRDLHRQQRPDEVQDRREQHRRAWLQRPRGDDRCDDVAGVVEAVGEAERERRDDDDHQEQFAVHVPSAPASQPARP